MRIAALGILLTMLAGGSADAQMNAPVVEARAVMATDAAHADSPIKLAVIAQVAAGYHINAHKPSLDYLIPTEIKMDPANLFIVKSVAYPKGALKKFAFSDAPLAVYEGDVLVGTILQSAKPLPPGNYTVKAKFAYQACNDHACLPPASVPISLTIKIVPHNVPLKQIESDVFERIQFE